MKRGTKIGWILVACSVFIFVWVLSNSNSKAEISLGDGFYASDNGTTLIRYDGAGGAITLPSTANGTTITSIADGVFMNNTSITSVTIPSTYTSMGSAAFSGCTALQSASLGNVTSIPSEAFRNCSSLSSITIPGTVSSIGGNAFNGCASLRSVTIPSSVSSIASGAFDNCRNLTSFSVDGGNGNYSSINGCLYNKAGTILLKVPEGMSTLTLSSNCQTIQAGALSNSSISNPTIPATVTSIGEQSNWSPDVITGYSGSAAETYAVNHNIDFVAIDAAEDPDPDPTPTDPDDNNNNNNNNNNNDNNNDNNGDNNGDNNNGDSGNNGNSGTGNSGSGTTGGGNSASGGGRSGSTNGSTGSTHAKDSTPQTADGDIDPRFWLCLALFLGGGGMILMGRKSKMEYIAGNRKR